MKIFKKQGFKLPYLGRDKFISLTRIGLGYVRGSFFIRDPNNAETILDTLSETLNEKIVFTQNCLICEKEFLCTDCRYYDACPTKNLPFHCICENCSQNNELFEQYVEKENLKLKRLQNQAQR